MDHVCTWHNHPFPGLERFVCYSDECMFYSCCNNGSVCVSRRCSEEHLKECCLPTFAQGRVRVMVWACIAYGRKGPLVILKYPGREGGGFNQDQYIDQVLKGPLLEFYGKLLQEHGCSLFLQDNLKCHTAAKVMEWLEDHQIQMMPHPAVSPDINAVEPCWADMKCDIAS